MSSNVVRVPDLIARRGNAFEFPENTLPGLRSALELGARFIQFDVQLTADHIPVLLQDASLQRTAGLDRSAFEMSWRVLGEVRVNESARFGERYRDLGVPSLVQAVELLNSRRDTTAFVQIQRASLRTFGTELTIRRVLDALKPVAQQCVLISADLAAVHHIRQISQYRIGWVLAEYSNLSALKSEALQPDYLFCDHALLTDSTSRLWRGPWRWAIHDVSERRLALELAARGARLVGTTHVRAMLREFRSR